MKLMLIAAAAGLVSLGLSSGGLWSANEPEMLPVDPIHSASVPAVSPSVSSFAISNIVARTACLVERGGEGAGRSQPFEAGADCDLVWPGLSTAKTWTESDDGTIAIADARGEAIIKVAVGDGLAYEAMDPPNAMLTLISAD